MVENAKPHAVTGSGLPQVFGRYLLVQRLSRGGMGEIFLARHGLSGFEKLVVIKKVLPHLAEDEQFISRFVDEALVAVNLQHANIAQVFEVGRVGNEYFLSLEYVEGRDLRRTFALLRSRGERMPTDLALFVAREVASGLAYAHRRTDDRGDSLKIVHCDISPPNIMLSLEGEVKIIDFGIAKSARRGTATDPKLGFGKFGYMAPEQLIRGFEVDFRTDIYAVGVILHELLTGERLYAQGETPDYRALARMVAKGQHPLPSHVDPSLAQYDGLVARALRPDPGERYQTAAEFRDEIQQALVSINPTLSSDNLSAYVNQLFAEELADQRREVARAEATDIEPWAALLTTESATTVSYAMAHLPLVAPETSVISKPLPGPRRAWQRGPWLVVAVLALVLLVGGSVLALVGQSSATESKKDELAAGAGGSAAAEPAAVLEADSVAPLAVSVTPLADAEKADPGAASAEPTVARIEEPARPKVRARSHRSERKSVDKSSRPSESKAVAEPTADASKKVHSKFRAVSREYRAFRKSYGARLEAEWADLATYAQFARSADKLRVLDRRIDQFRARMRKARE